MKLSKTETKIMEQIARTGRAMTTNDVYKWVREENAVASLIEKGLIERDGTHPNDIIGGGFSYWCAKGNRQEYADECLAAIKDDAEKRDAKRTPEQRAELEAYQSALDAAIASGMSYEQFCQQMEV